MSRRDAGSGGVPQGGARFRLFVHSLGQARGAGLSSGACPFEEECIEASAAARNGSNLAMPYQAALNGPPEFRALAAARRWSLARPYFRGRPPMALACPGGRGQVGSGCPLAATIRPAAQQSEAPRPAAQSPEAARAAPGFSDSKEAPRRSPAPSREPAPPARVQSARHAPAPVTAPALEAAPALRAAAPTSSGRRTIPWSSPGSTRAG
jgi:hypothetical protein